MTAPDRLALVRQQMDREEARAAAARVAGLLEGTAKALGVCVVALLGLGGLGCWLLAETAGWLAVAPLAVSVLAVGITWAWAALLTAGFAALLRLMIQDRVAT